MEIEVDQGNRRKRAAQDVWEVKALKESLEIAGAKRQKYRPYVMVKTVSGTAIRLEPFSDFSGQIMCISDIKRSLVEDHGLSLDNTALLFERKNVTNMDSLEIETGSTLYAILRVGGCSSEKPYAERGYTWS